VRELAAAREHIVLGMVYTIEKEQRGKYVYYRVASIAQKRPKFRYELRGDVMVEVPLRP
jgi:hypothetical protein